MNAASRLSPTPFLWLKLDAHETRPIRTVADCIKFLGLIHSRLQRLASTTEPCSFLISPEFQNWNGVNELLTHGFVISGSRPVSPWERNELKAYWENLLQTDHYEFATA